MKEFNDKYGKKVILSLLTVGVILILLEYLYYPRIEPYVHWYIFAVWMASVVSSFARPNTKQKN